MINKKIIIVSFFIILVLIIFAFFYIKASFSRTGPYDCTRKMLGVKSDLQHNEQVQSCSLACENWFNSVSCPKTFESELINVVKNCTCTCCRNGR